LDFTVQGVTAGSQVITTFGKMFLKTRITIPSFLAPSCLFQLSLRMSKPPAGSVEAMFRATGSEKTLLYQGTDLGPARIGSSVSDSKRENMDLNNATSTPDPTPRSNQPTPATQQHSSKHSLSDWDLEDFDE
jgi:hypothetical protein